MTSLPAFVAIDWGTTNRRAYRCDASGTILDEMRDDRGVTRIAPGGFAGEVAAIRARLGDYPVIAAGMVGSVRGWALAPYVAAPAGLDELGLGLLAVEPGRTFIVPGMSDPAGDVMRGEEVQFLGAMAGRLGGLDPLGEAVLCQPGTHCKWATASGGRITRFRTAMTGELFALLRDHSLLAEFLTHPVADGPAFRAGLAEAGRDDLLSALFRVRAAALLGQRAVGDSAAYASGLLIGADVRGQRLLPGQRVHLISDPALGALYTAAITASGGEAVAISSTAAFLGGIAHIWARLRATIEEKQQ